HAAGDRILRAVADRLLGAVRETDTVGRLGGDEFVVLAEGSVDDVAQVIGGRLHHALRAPFDLPGASRSFTMSASIGIAAATGSTAEKLLRDADIALYQAKAEGKARSVVFEQHMQVAISQRVELEMDLRLAL